MGGSPERPVEDAAHCVEVVITNTTTEAANSWKSGAGRTKGSSGYQFGDLTRTLVHRVSGTSASDANLARSRSESETDAEPEVGRVAYRVRAPWAKRLWDGAPLCDLLGKAGCARETCAGMSYAVDARDLAEAPLSARDVRACLAHADAVNGSFPRARPLAVPPHANTVEACAQLRVCFDAFFGRSAFDDVERAYPDARTAARLALALRRDEARRSATADLVDVLASKIERDVGAALHVFLAEEEGDDDFDRVEVPGAASSLSLDEIGRWRARYEARRGALDVLSDPQLGEKARADVAAALGSYGAECAWVTLRASATGATRPALLAAVNAAGAAPLDAAAILRRWSGGAAPPDDDGRAADALLRAVDDLERRKVLEGCAADRARAFLMGGCDGPALARLSRECGRRGNDAAFARSLSLLAARHLPPPPPPAPGRK